MPASESVVRLNQRDYTVSFADDGTPSCVRVHVQRHGYCIAMRRLPLTSNLARLAVLAAATAIHGVKTDGGDHA